MPTLQESILATQQSKVQLIEEQKKLAEAKKQAQQIQVPRRSLEFQQKYVRTGKVPIGRVEQYVEGQKRTKAGALKQIAQAEEGLSIWGKQIAEQEIELAKAKEQEDAYARAVRAIERKRIGKSYGLQPDDALAYKIMGELTGGRGVWTGSNASALKAREVSDYQAGLKSKLSLLSSAKEQGVSVQSLIKQSAVQQREMSLAGFKPVVVQGKITGYEDTKKGVSVGINQFGGYVENKRPELVSKFEKVGIFQKPEEATFKIQSGIDYGKVKLLSSEFYDKLKVGEKAQALKSAFFPTQTPKEFYEGVELTKDKEFTITKSTISGFINKDYITRTTNPWFSNNVIDTSLEINPLTGKPYGSVRPLTSGEEFRYTPGKWTKGLIKGTLADIRSGALLQAESQFQFTKEGREYVENKVPEILAWTDTLATRKEQARGSATILTGGLLTLPLDWKTKASLLGNFGKTERLFYFDDNAPQTQKEKINTLKDYGIALGSSMAGGALFGGAMKFGGKYLQKKGLEYIFRIGGSKVGKAFPQTFGLFSTSLIGGGKAIETGTDIYFRTKFLGEGIDVLQLSKEKRYEEAKLKATELTGGILGAYGGTYVGGKTFYTLFTKPSIKEAPGVKTRVPTVQAKLITSGQKVVSQRTEELSVKDLFKSIYSKLLKPNPDIYSPGDIQEPTAQKFFRINPKFKKGENVLFQPSFIGGKKFLSYGSKSKVISKGSNLNLFKQSYSFFRSAGAGRAKSLLLSLGEMPVTRWSMTRETRGILVKDKSLRKQIELEKATLGGLTSKTRKAYLESIGKKRSKTKSELELSDKALQRNIKKGSAYEEEAVTRKTIDLEQEKYRINFMADEKGNIIPIKEYGKFAGKFNLNTILSNIRANWKFKSDVRKLYGWEAKKQYGLFKKYGEGYVDPWQHSYPHAARTAELATILTYLELKGKNKVKIKGRESSIDVGLLRLSPKKSKVFVPENAPIRQIAKAYKAGLMHDIGKSQEASGVEGGWEHGFRAWEVGRKGGLPIKVSKSWLEAIKVHDTLKKSQFKRASFEKKILKSADVLQLGFEFRNGKIVASRYYKGKVSEWTLDKNANLVRSRGVRLEEVPIQNALGKIQRFTEQEKGKAELLGKIFRISPKEIKMTKRISLIKKVLYPKESKKENLSKLINTFKLDKRKITRKEIDEPTSRVRKYKPIKKDFEYSKFYSKDNIEKKYLKEEYKYKKDYTKQYASPKTKYRYSPIKYYPTKGYYEPKIPIKDYPKYKYKAPYEKPPIEKYPPKYPPYVPTKIKPPKSPPPTITILPIMGKYKPKIKQKAKLFKSAKYTPSIGASILKITAKKKPGKLAGGYTPGWRPLLKSYE